MIAKRYHLWEENHRCMDVPHHEENPARLLAIYRRLCELEDRLLARVYPWNHTIVDDQRDEECMSTNDRRHTIRRFIRLPFTPASRETIELVHSPEHYEWLESTASMTEQELKELFVMNDLYFNNYTFLAATLAAGAVVGCVAAVADPDLPVVVHDVAGH